MVTTYYVVKQADGQDIPSQKRKLGTPRYGYATLALAKRYTPPGGYVEMRHTSGWQDWGDQIVWARPD